MRQLAARGGRTSGRRSWSPISLPVSLAVEALRFGHGVEGVEGSALVSLGQLVMRCDHGVEGVEGSALVSLGQLVMRCDHGVEAVEGSALVSLGQLVMRCDHGVEGVEGSALAASGERWPPESTPDGVIRSPKPASGVPIPAPGRPPCPICPVWGRWQAVAGRRDRP